MCHVHLHSQEIYGSVFGAIVLHHFLWVPPLLMPASFTVFMYVTLYLCTWVTILLPWHGRPRSQAGHVFWCYLKRLSCLLGRFICAQLGSFPLVPTTSLGSRFPSHPEVTPLRTQLPWLIMAESHLQGSVSGHDFHGWSAPSSLEPRTTSTLRTVSTPVNSQGHLKWKCGIFALSRHTK